MLPPKHSAPLCRVATETDIPALTAMAVEFRNHNKKLSPSDAEFLTGITRLVQGNDGEFIVVEHEGETCGYTLLRWRFSMWANGLDATLEDLFVKEDCRKLGLGARLVAAALDRARERGALTIHLDTNEKNPASNRIYLEQGFSCHSKRWDGNQVFYRKALVS